MIAVMQPSATAEDIEHVAVLGGDTHATGDSIGMPSKLEDDGSELDGLGPCPEDSQDLQRWGRHGHATSLGQRLAARS